MQWLDQKNECQQSNQERNHVQYESDIEVNSHGFKIRHGSFLWYCRAVEGTGYDYCGQRQSAYEVGSKERAYHPDAIPPE